MVALKICGLTRREDYRVVAKLGIDFAGFIFHPDSPRYVSPGEVRQLTAGIPGKNPRKVGVFVDVPIPRVREIFHRSGLDIVQLHGDESPGYCRRLGLPCWKALRPDPESGWGRNLREYPCEAILLDGYHPVLRGGTGRALDPRVITEALRSGRKIVVAGGVSPHNLTGICRLGPWGVDANSSVESGPGIKDHRKLRRLAENWRRIRREGIHAGL